MKDKKKTKTIPRQVRWDKLDNTAHLFPSIAGESMTNVYRISVTLKEEVQVEFLQQALDMILPKFDGFNLRMRTGVFWYYFEENGKKAPKVTEEAMFPCRFIRQNKNRNYLFRVTYYKSRINLEVFHVLTDGMGGINFLRELTYQYLRLVHPELAEKEGIKSIAFCCISTGEFHFPNKLAAEIAVKTVDKYLSSSKLERVIFNVFKEEDYNIYKKIFA